APDGTEHSRAAMRDVSPGNDRYEAWLAPDAQGMWGIRVEGWSDPYSTWRHDAELKVHAEVDTELMLTEGQQLLQRAGKELAGGRTPAQARTLAEAADTLADTSRPALARLAAGTSQEVQQVLAQVPLREFVSPSATYPLRVHRPRALYGSWYEMFPRSEGAYQD